MLENTGHEAIQRKLQPHDEVVAKDGGLIGSWLRIHFVASRAKRSGFLRHKKSSLDVILDFVTCNSRTSKAKDTRHVSPEGEVPTDSESAVFDEPLGPSEELSPEVPLDDI